MTTTAALVTSLQAIVSADQIVTSLDERTFYSTDISASGEIAELIVRVSTVEQLASTIRVCTERGRIVIPRGGGFSYTGGYIPVAGNSVIVDLRGLNRIIDINTEDMYVTVEVGCTWEKLYEALKAKGVRTPYFGPMSGYSATVGGALSQGSLFLGSSQYGVVAESVLALEVVVADGSIVRTGSWSSTIGTGPFMRNYGPDLTGLFLSDTGALGFKARAVLKLIPFPPHQQFGSFVFDDEHRAIKALSDIGRAGLTAECYCWDPYFVKMMSASNESLAEDLKFLTGVAKDGQSRIKGFLNAARIAIAGKKIFGGDLFILNIVIDDLSEAGAFARLEAVRVIVDHHDGREIIPSAPMALRGTPFTNFNVPRRREKLRSLPINSLSPHSKAGEVTSAVRAFLERNKEELSNHKINCGVIYFAVGAQAVTCEPIFYWEDEEHYHHNRLDDKSDLAALSQFSDRPEATKVALALRKELRAIFAQQGCVHVQIGKSYPYLKTREPATLALLEAIKNVVDPRDLMNRGSLGFGAHD